MARVQALYISHVAGENEVDSTSQSFLCEEGQENYPLRSLLPLLALLYTFVRRTIVFIRVLVTINDLIFTYINVLSILNNISLDLYIFNPLFRP